MPGLIGARWLTGILLAILVSAPAPAYDADAAAKDFRESYSAPQPFAVLGGWQGGDSAVTEPSVDRIIDAASWAALWQRHAPGTTVPAIDFSQSMVVTIFWGRVSQQFGTPHLHAVTATSDIEIVSSMSVSDVIYVETHNPYLFVVLARSREPITVIGRTWTLMARTHTEYTVIAEIPGVCPPGKQWMSRYRSCG